jgi:hypothetical protein
MVRVPLEWSLAFTAGPLNFHFGTANSILQPGTGVGGSLALCGLIAGCGDSFDKGPPPPSKAQMGAEVAFSHMGTSSTVSNTSGSNNQSRDPWFFKPLTAQQSACLNKEREQWSLYGGGGAVEPDIIGHWLADTINESPVSFINAFSLYALTDERQRKAGAEWATGPLAKYAAYKLFMKFGGATLRKWTPIVGRSMAKGAGPAVAVATMLDSFGRIDCNVSLVPSLK